MAVVWLYGFMVRPNAVGQSSSPPQIGGAEWRRIGEAKNPGPYYWGGASSSASGAGGQQAVDAVALRGLVREPTHAAAGHARQHCRFDDPDDWTFAEEGSTALGRTADVPAGGNLLTAGKVEFHPSHPGAGGAAETYSPRSPEPADYEVCLAEDGEVVDDAVWNRYLDTICAARGNMSPEEVAYNWALKQQQHCYEREWNQFLKELGPETVDSTASAEDVAAQVKPEEKRRPWKAPVETDYSKALKWRKRMQASRPNADLSQPKVVEEIRAVFSPEDGQETVALPGVQTQGEGSTEDQGKSRRPTRASRRSKLMSVYTMNTSGRPAAIRALSMLTRKAAKSVAAVAIQEHHCTESAVPDLQRQAEREGWRLYAVPAVVKAEGPSAGVAVATPKHIPCAVTGVVNLDLSPAGSGGRVAALWVQAAIPGGLLVVSVYLWHSEGLTARNRDILNGALGAVAAHGGPWVIVGDFNYQPARLAEELGPSLEKAGAVILAPDRPTHYPGGEGALAILDYCVADDRIANSRVIRSVAVDEGLTIGRHRAVKITLSNKGHVSYVTKMLKPKAFPRRAPIGCARMLVIPDKACEGADERYKAVLECAEQEVARLHDLVGEDGFARDDFTGRGRGFHTKRTLLLPGRATASVGNAGSEACILKWVHERASELQHCRQRQAEGSLSLTGLKQVLGICRRMRSLSRDKNRMSLLCKVDSRWEEWASRLAAWDFDAPAADIDVPLAESWNQSLELSRKHQGVARKRWREWVKDKLKGGAPAIHSLIKRAAEQPLVLTGNALAMDASPQAILEADQSQWKKIWTRLEGKHPAPWTTWAMQQCDCLTAITGKDVRKAAMTFSVSTAIGEDGLQPRAFQHLSNTTLESYAQVLNQAEAQGEWPSLVANSLIHLIPKPSGGRRPIGVMATLVRLYERIRRGLVCEWRAKRAETCNYMTGGRSAVDAVWTQSVRDEAAQETGIVSASSLLDLIKAFECVRLDVVWESGRRLGFPLAVLRLSLKAYCKARRLIYRGIVGEQIFTKNAILAGGGLATDMLSLLLSETLDMLRERIPSVHLYVVVDDLTVRVEGHASHVAENIVRATALCISDLEGRLDMRVSRGKPWQIEADVKSVAVSTSRKARELMATGLRALGILVKGHTRNLGVDYTPGKKARKKVVLMNRWKQVKNKAKRCRMVGKEAATVVGRSALVPAISYGASCSGVATGFLHDLRTMMAELGGPMKGRSTTARLALAGTDPSFPLVLAPLQAWWKAAWEDLLPREVLASALRRAARNAREAGHLMHAHAEGGAGAFVSAMARIGWRAISVDTYLLASGITLKLGQDCDPRMLKALAMADLEEVIAAQSGLSEELSSIDKADGFHRATSRASGFKPLGTLPGLLEEAQQKWWEEFRHLKGRLVPWMKPAIDAMRSAKAKGASLAALSSFRAMFEGGWWTQGKFHFHGMASSPLCRACDQEHGTFWHRVAGRCKPAEDEPPWTTAEETSVEEGKKRWWDPLYSRGVAALPLTPVWPKPFTASYPPEANEVVLTGHVYTDGAMRGVLAQARRSGWAFAQVDPITLELVVAYYGHSGGPWHSVLRAELQAIDEALMRAVEPLTIHTDSQIAVSAFGEGKAYCCASKSEGADIWARIWSRLDGFGKFELCKVKAHTTVEDALEGLISAVDQAGNAAADFFAVQARLTAQRESPVDSFERHYARARKWYAVVLRAIGGWKDDAVADLQQEGGRGQEQERQQEYTAREDQKGRGHELWKLPQQVVCRTCGKRFAPVNLATVARRRCEGPMRARLLDSMGAFPSFARVAHTVPELLRAGASPWIQPNVADDNAVSGNATQVGASQLVEAQSAALQGASSNREQRRRLTGKQPDPNAAAVAAIKEEATGHLLVSKGRLTFCERCGRWALDRLSTALRKRCAGTVETAKGSYRIRRQRMREGRHPLSNALL